MAHHMPTPPDQGVEVNRHRAVRSDGSGVVAHDSCSNSSRLFVPQGPMRIAQRFISTLGPKTQRDSSRRDS